MNLSRSKLGVLLGLVIGVALVSIAGCNSSATSRNVSKAEVDQSDQKRQDYVKSLNVPDSVKQQMAAHMGGPPAPPLPAAPQKSSTNSASSRPTGQ